MRKFVYAAMFLILAMGLVYPLAAEQPDPEELAYESYETAYFQGDDVRWRASMEIVDDQDRTRSRVLTILRKNVGEESQKYYAYFHEPSQLERMVFLVWTAAGMEDDDRWLYMPATDMQQRISGRQKRNSFAGTDFTYEDMTGRHPDQDEFEYLGTDEVDERPVYVIKGEPRDPDLVEFSYYEMYIDQETKLPLKGEFYDPQEELHRTLRLPEFEEIDGYYTPTLQVAENHSTGSKTTAEMSNIEYNLGIGEDIFAERYLRRPPTQWIDP